MNETESILKKVNKRAEKFRKEGFLVIPANWIVSSEELIKLLEK